MDQVQSQLWLNRAEQKFLSQQRLCLLEQVAQQGSISKAAQALNISYKTAWDQVEAMNNLSPKLLVTRETGGRGGGGAYLTAYAEQLIAAYRALEAEHQRFLVQLNQRFNTIQGVWHFMNVLNIQTSARNQFFGRVKQVKAGPVHCEVCIALKGGDELVSVITQESMNTLGLENGREVFALVKASQVLLLPAGEQLRLSTRNQFDGTVVEITAGPVSAEVSLQLPGGTLLKSVITKESLDELEIKLGMQLRSAFKASSVILAVNG